LDALLDFDVEGPNCLSTLLTILANHHRRVSVQGFPRTVGCLRRIQKSTPIIKHVFELYAPKSPSAFFDDVILGGLLEQYVGAAMVQRLRLRYQAPRGLEGYEEDSASFGEVFHPDFSNPLYAKDHPETLLGRQSGHPESHFDRRAFTDEVL
jgi:replication initiation and membrane attachment protein DnaB